MTTNLQAIEAVRALADIIEETAREAGPMGAPSGVIYSALMGVGVSLQVYQSILSAMVDAGRISISADCIRVAA